MCQCANFSLTTMPSSACHVAYSDYVILKNTLQNNCFNIYIYISVAICEYNFKNNSVLRYRYEHDSAQQ